VQKPSGRNDGGDLFLRKLLAQGRPVPSDDRERESVCVCVWVSVSAKMENSQSTMGD
jgi:hypothetical protein